MHLFLTASCVDLKEQNETMKLYVDHLVARVMEESPESLSARPAARRKSKSRTVTV